MRRNIGLFASTIPWHFRRLGKVAPNSWRVWPIVVQYRDRASPGPAAGHAAHVLRAVTLPGVGLCTGDPPMGNDMVVALPRSTADGITLFGHNCNRPRSEPQMLVRLAGRLYTAGENVRLPSVTLPQVKQTFGVVASRGGSSWGYSCGVNEHGVAAGLTDARTRMRHEGPGLTGPDLVRLALERSSSALQAVDVVTDLVSRHGPGAVPCENESGDPILLLADGHEAYLLATCGRYWALQEVREVRAQTDVCHLRQDWDRISPGLAGLAIEHGWWSDDGSKLDFAAALVEDSATASAGLRRWGRATVMLEQHNGQLDATIVRQLLTELGEAVRTGAESTVPSGSLIARLASDDRGGPMAWWCCSAETAGVYLPLAVEGDLPELLSTDDGCEACRELQRLETLAQIDGQVGLAMRSAFAGLQARLDRDANDFVVESTEFRSRRDRSGLQRLATNFMQHVSERFTETCDEIRQSARGASKPAYVATQVEVAMPS